MKTHKIGRNNDKKSSKDIKYNYFEIITRYNKTRTQNHEITCNYNCRSDHIKHKNIFESMKRHPLKILAVLTTLLCFVFIQMCNLAVYSYRKYILIKF